MRGSGLETIQANMIHESFNALGVIYIDDETGNLY
jgi:hypothetical protein